MSLNYIEAGGLGLRAVSDDIKTEGGNNVERHKKSTVASGAPLASGNPIPEAGEICYNAPIFTKSVITPSTPKRWRESIWPFVSGV